MFDSLSSRLGSVLDRLRGQGRLTDDNINTTLREIRMALLEADVALPVVREFIDSIREKATGEVVLKSLTPGQTLIKLVNTELTRILGKSNESLNLSTQPPAVILLAGLQGSGKTTTVAKLSRFIKERYNKKVMVVSTDVYRPAAIDQLEVLAKDVDVDFYPSKARQKPVKIAKRALADAKKQFTDVLIIDTAGRLHIDEEMIKEIKELHVILNPIETLFVVDSMTGQDAANTSKAFDEALPLSGVILTKTDGDSRGGAALSIRQITGKPIKFLGVGEKTDALEPFHPERLASRILGMGDVLSLVEEVSQKIEHKKAQKLAKKVTKGQRFTLVDFREQMMQMANMGGMTALMDKLPGMNKIPEAVKNQVNDKEIMRTVAMINSMTPQERDFPAIIKGSRRKRIAEGSGVKVQDVNKMLKNFMQMQKMMKKMKGKTGMMKMMRGLGNTGGPAGMGSFPFK